MPPTRSRHPGPGGAIKPLVVTAALVLVLVSLPLSAPARAPCAEGEAFHLLDFWLGEWEVFVGGRKVGENRIEKVLSGCAILEHWSSARGEEGMSLFYHDPVGGGWKQVWLTEDTTRPGGLKEKRLIERLGDGGVRFQGEIRLPEGDAHLDRTSLIPRDDGTVRQVIERSTDGGATWETGFDAIYRPAGRSDS